MAGIAFAPSWNRRVVQWCIFACILLILLGVFGLRVRWVQGMAERAAVVSMLGVLRTALVVGYVKNAPVRRNPFLWLEKPPTRYGGEVRMGHGETMAPGQWVFDPVCVCVGYRLLQPHWLEQPRATETLWFRITGAETGPLQVTALEHYVWQGEVVQ